MSFNCVLLKRTGSVSEIEISSFETDILFSKLKKHGSGKPQILVIWEIDEFHGMNEGLFIAEVELSNENQKIELPDFIIEEVTGINKYYNSNLQKSPFTLWKDKFSK